MEAPESKSCTQAWRNLSDSAVPSRTLEQQQSPVHSNLSVQ